MKRGTNESNGGTHSNPNPSDERVQVGSVLLQDFCPGPTRQILTFFVGLFASTRCHYVFCVGGLRSKFSWMSLWTGWVGRGPKMNLPLGGYGEEPAYCGEVRRFVAHDLADGRNPSREVREGETRTNVIVHRVVEPVGETGYSLSTVCSI